MRPKRDTKLSIEPGWQFSNAWFNVPDTKYGAMRASLLNVGYNSLGTTQFWLWFIQWLTRRRHSRDVHLDAFWHLIREYVLGYEYESSVAMLDYYLTKLCLTTAQTPTAIQTSAVVCIEPSKTTTKNSSQSQTYTIYVNWRSVSAFLHRTIKRLFGARSGAPYPHLIDAIKSLSFEAAKNHIVMMERSTDARTHTRNANICTRQKQEKSSDSFLLFRHFMIRYLSVKITKQKKKTCIIAHIECTNGAVISGGVVIRSRVQHHRPPASTAAAKKKHQRRTKNHHIYGLFRKNK